VVRDAKTGEDLTRSILLQIILEEEAGGAPMFTEAVLAHIIRFYGHAMQGFMGSYLEKNVQAFTDIQAKLAEQSQGLTPEMWSQFMRLQSPVMQGVMGNYLEQSSKMFLDMQEKMKESTKQFFPGFTFPGFYAAMASAYMHQYGMKPEHLMNVAIKNHDNASLNPNAQFGVTIQKWMEGRVAAALKKGKPAPTWSTIWDFLHDEAGNPTVAWPLRLFDCSPVTDGAAAILLVAEERMHEFTDHPIHVIGSGQASGSALHDRPELTAIPAAKIAATKAYEMAGVTAKDIRIAEVHDCFTIAEVIASEDLGFFVPGEGFKAAEDGVTARNGAKPINTSGGLKAKGHPVGASGVAQAVEVFKQMRGQAGERQVAGDVNIALTHNVGATGSTCAVHVYERRN